MTTTIEIAREPERLKPSVGQGRRAWYQAWAEPGTSQTYQRTRRRVPRTLTTQCMALREVRRGFGAGMGIGSERESGRGERRQTGRGGAGGERQGRVERAEGKGPGRMHQGWFRGGGSQAFGVRYRVGISGGNRCLGKGGWIVLVLVYRTVNRRMGRYGEVSFRHDLSVIKNGIKHDNTYNFMNQDRSSR